MTYYGCVFPHGTVRICVTYSTLSNRSIFRGHDLMEDVVSFCCLNYLPNRSTERYSMTVSPRGEIWGDPAPESANQLTGINQG